MLKLHIQNETNLLKSVLLGTAKSNGKTPLPEEAYDPKSLEHILLGTYPCEKDMIHEMEEFRKVLEKYGVEVIRPEIIENYNQIFTRDIGFVIDDFFIKARILSNRSKEIQAISFLLSKINPEKLITPPENVRIEGGDVILYNNYIFIGTYKNVDFDEVITARTNMEGVEFIRNLFPNKIVKEFDLVKSVTEPRDNALHLDCCFQPIGKNKAILYKGGFKNESDYLFLKNLFGSENVFEITRQEMYHMNSNIFSISENIIVSEKSFTRLNDWLKQQGFIVETISYSEISKQEGLLRCSTLPLCRE